MVLHVPDERLAAQWEQPVYQVLALQNEPLYLINEHWYIPFFNGIRGPLLTPVWAEVCVIGEFDKGYRLQQELEARVPATRWRVYAVTAIEEFLKLQPIRALQGAIRIEGHARSLVVLDLEVLDQIRRGLICAAHSLTEETRLRINELSGLYPGLQTPGLAREPCSIFDEWDELLEAVHLQEIGGRRDRTPVSPLEQPFIDLILDWHHSVCKDKQLVRMPPKADLPAGDPWIACDASFREWTIRQMTGSTAGTDPYLKKALMTQTGYGQKSTHEGWEVAQHAITAMLQLSADEYPPRIRKCLRLTMLWHDAGKADNVSTPGAHGWFSAKMWEPPGDLNEEEEQLVTFLISSHDVFGLLDRWVHDPSYKGGLSPSTIRKRINKDGYQVAEVLPLIRAVYEADIASVSTLRWLLPLTPFLTALIEAGVESDGSFLSL